MNALPVCARAVVCYWFHVGARMCVLGWGGGGGGWGSDVKDAE